MYFNQRVFFAIAAGEAGIRKAVNGSLCMENCGVDFFFAQKLEKRRKYSNLILPSDEHLKKNANFVSG